MGNIKSAIDRAKLFSKFMNWLVNKGKCRYNPFDDLSRNYRGGFAGIFRALISEDADSQLEALRRPVKYGSFLGAEIKNCIQRHRALGYRYGSEKVHLLGLDRFLQTRPSLRRESLAGVIQAWSDSRERLSHKYFAQRAGRLLWKELHRTDASIPPIVVDANLLSRVRKLYRKPTIYSSNEVHHLLETALPSQSASAPLRSHCIYMMIVLAYCCGLRIGEIARLRMGDLLLDDGEIEIRHSKFFKSRRVTLSTSAREALKTYLAVRVRSGAPTSPDSGVFWSTVRRKEYAYGTARQMLTMTLRAASLKPGIGLKGPRIHDLRHSFAVNRLLDWYRSGINPQSQLPHLATYMGHVDIGSTLVYLTMTPELNRIASERFRKYGVRALGVVRGDP
jgi:integrase